MHDLAPTTIDAKTGRQSLSGQKGRRTALSRDAISLIHAAWNAMAAEHGLTQCRAIKGQRLARLRARVADSSVETVLDAIASIPNASFLLGHNDRGWQADFDFLVQEKSFNRILEGFYSRLRNRARGDQSQERSSDYAQRTANQMLGAVLQRPQFLRR